MNNPSFKYNYEEIGSLYSTRRQTDDRIAKYIINALGSSKTILNVGAGSGSYEPEDKCVISIEPSHSMRLQRLNNNKHPAVTGIAESLPFDDKSFDASMAILTIHHWSDLRKGLEEMRRVTRDLILLMTYDPDSLGIFWNINYFPELVEIEKNRYPNLQTIRAILGPEEEMIKVPIPLDCKDSFQEAFYGRPEFFLKQEIRDSQSAWAFLKPGLEEILVKRLEKDLQSGGWDQKYGRLRTQPSFEGALRLLIFRP